MKKLICFALVAVLALSLMACTETPATKGTATAGAITNPTATAPNSADNGFPLTYTPECSLEFVKTEDNPEGTLAYGYGGFAYDPKEEIVLEYCKATDELFTALKGYSDWPTELNDTWKGYGYVGIETVNNNSIRTLAVGKFGEKHAKVILDYENALYKDGFDGDDKINKSPEDESKRYVNYCMLVADGEVSIQQIATAAYNALYLQAWHLIPADNQGVLVSANGRTYTVSDIISELAG